MKIDRNSYGSVAMAYLFGICVSVAVFALSSSLYIEIPVLLLMLSFCVWQTFFFRVPQRCKAGDSSSVSAVADGEIVIIDKVFEQEYLKKECIQVSIYMDFWNVHANFWPVTGQVVYSQYHPGRHLLAFKPKASEDNEHSTTCIRTMDGHDVLYKQLAGTFARRIVSYSKPGMDTVSGDQCGIIKFGSRIDMFLPLDAEICVEIGQKTRACETVIARLNS